MHIFARVGTHPQGYYKAVRKRTNPVVGDKLLLRGASLWTKYETFNVVVTEIRDMDDYPLYVYERM